MGNDDFIVNLYSDYNKRIAYFIKSQIYSKDFADVEDCVQEVFLIVTRKVKSDSMPNHPNTLGWLYSIAKNVSNKFNASYLKNKTIRLESEDADAIFNDSDFANQSIEDIIYKEINQEELIHKMKGSLPKNERDLFEMKFEKRLSNDEIADILNKSNDAVRTKCTRIKQKLKDFTKNL